MRRLKISRIILLALLVFCFLAVMAIAIVEFNSMQVIYYDSYGIIGNRIGFDGDLDKLGFGMIIPGGSSTKSINIMNGAITKAGYVYIRGDIAPLVQVSDSPFIIEPYENKTLVFIMSAPYGQEQRRYSGEVKIVLKGKR